MHRVFLVLCLTRLLSGQTNPLAGNPAAIDVGKGNFRLYCAPCHGIHAQGGRGPDLTRRSFAAGDSDADLFRVISQGVEGTEMTAYAGHFEDPMIWRLISYIRSVARVSPVPIPGDARHCRELFAGKGGCNGCHSIGGEGGGIGPPLTRVGRERSLDYLREKLLTPSASITPGYHTILVTLRDGHDIRGIEKGFDDFSAQLLDVNRKFYSFRKEEVASMKREDRSLMPSNYSQKLSPAEQTDLLAYLASLRNETNAETRGEK
jgi:putative heme-binding domain-containing protein